MARWVIIIHPPISECQIKNAAHELSEPELILKPRHMGISVTSDDKLITFTDPNKAVEYAKKQMSTLPPFKYSFALIQVR